SINKVGYNREFRNLEPGTYTFEFVQVGECLSSRSEEVTIQEPIKLKAVISDSTISLPDQPTGSITVRVDEFSGTRPFFAMAERISPENQRIAGDTIRQNQSNLRYELTFNDLYPGEYNVYVRDANGCDVTLNVMVGYDTRIFIPNVFTPNGDGVNDEFQIRNLPLEGGKMIITNRWGKIVYRNEAYNEEKYWDGGGLSDGIYYYKLILEEESFSGWVEIWRGSSR